MQQIRKIAKQKRVRKPNSFSSVNSTWCSIEYVKITFTDDIEESIETIKKLLEVSDLELARTGEAQGESRC